MVKNTSPETGPDGRIDSPVDAALLSNRQMEEKKKIEILFGQNTDEHPRIRAALHVLLKECQVDANGLLRPKEHHTANALRELFPDIDKDIEDGLFCWEQRLELGSVQSGARPYDGERYSVNWERNNLLGEQQAVLERHLQGKRVLLDLGGGSPDEKGTTSMQRLAQEQGFLWYIDQDKSFTGFQGLREVRNRYEKVKQLPGMQATYCGGSMLEALNALPDSCTGMVVSLNGIDDIILPDNDYHREIAKLLGKKLGSGSVVMTCGSTASEYLGRVGFTLAEGFQKSWNRPELWVKS